MVSQQNNYGIKCHSLPVFSFHLVHIWDPLSTLALLLFLFPHLKYLPSSLSFLFFSPLPLPSSPGPGFSALQSPSTREMDGGRKGISLDEWIDWTNTIWPTSADNLIWTRPQCGYPAMALH